MDQHAAILHLAVDGKRLSPSAWHGWLYRALGERGDDYHREGTPPFALQLGTESNHARVTLLDGSLAESLMEALVVEPGRPGPADRTILRTAWEQVSYDRLLAAGYNWAGELSLEFQTPTAFRQGSYTLPVPMPGLVFGGLHRIWQRFAGSPLPGFDPVQCERHVELRMLSLRSRRYSTGLGSAVGVVGWATYRHPDGLDGTLGVLGAFGELAGVGIKRAFGMGATRVLPEAGSQAGIGAERTS